MKKLNYEELKIVNGGAAETKDRMTTVGSKDGASITMSLDDFYWLVDKYGWCFSQKFTSDEILHILIKHHQACA